MSSDEKVLDFPRVEVTSEENARRVMVEARRLARLAPGEWRLWIDRSAERLRIPRAILEDVIAAIIKDSEKKARDAETEARRHELAVRREQERKQREQKREQERTGKRGGSWLARISQRRWGLRFPEYAPQGSASRPRLPAPGSARSDQIANDHQPRRDAYTRLEGRVGLQSTHCSHQLQARSASSGQANRLPFPNACFIFE